jgi:hypothetical protein
MGIDGIGKPGSPGGPGPTGGASGAGVSGASKTFEVGRAESGGEVGAVGGVESPDLSALDRGEISLDQYLDRRVEQALDHLAGKVSPDQLDFVRATLREQLQTDPVLVEMIRRATGQDVSGA